MHHPTDRITHTTYLLNNALNTFLLILKTKLNDINVSMNFLNLFKDTNDTFFWNEMF